MAKKRKTYSEEFKIEAVQKWLSSGQSAAEVEAELGLSKGSLYKWKRQLGDEALLSAEQAVEDAQEEPTETEPSPVVDEDEGRQIAEEPASDEGEVVELASAAASEAVASEAAEAETPEAEPGMSEPVAETVPESNKTALEPVVVAAEKKPNRALVVLKRIAGAAGIALGTIGFILSLAAIVAIWAVNTPLTESALQFLNRIEIGLTVAGEGLDQADGTLTEVRAQLVAVTEAFPAEELTRFIEDVETIVAAAQSTADTASTVVGLANSVPFIGGGGSSGASATPTLDQSSQTLEEISTKLEAVRVALVSRSEGDGSGLLGQIDAEIAQLQALLQNVDSSVEESTTVVIQLQLDLPGWIDIASAVFTLLLLWLGLAQISLLAHGWEWLRG